MPEAPIIVSFASQEALAAEWATTLSKGGLSATLTHAPEPRRSYTVVLQHPSRSAEFELPATVVMVQTVTGGFSVGFQLDNFDRALGERLRAFAEEVDEAVEPEAEPETEPETEPEAEPESPPEARNAQERLRGLALNDQLKIAREGALSERVILERLYGKTVWEALLRNPRITPPEVARIARMGTLPRPLIELIAGTAAWLAHAIVRRALLANPRLTPEGINKVLLATPDPELKTIRTQTAYPAAVREAARRRLGR